MRSQVNTVGEVHSPICSTFEALVAWQWLSTIVENWAHSVDQYQLLALQFLMHLIDLLSILLRWNGFARIQKAVMNQMDSRPPNSDHVFFWCKSGFEKCFQTSSQTNRWADCHWLSYKIHFSSHVTTWSRNG